MNTGLSWIWPDVLDENSAKWAAKSAFYAASIVAIMTTIIAVSSEVIDIIALSEAIIFAIIAFGILKMSRVAAVCGLSIYILEKIYAWIIMENRITVSSFFILLFLLHGVRGAFAYHKHKTRRIND